MSLAKLVKKILATSPEQLGRFHAALIGHATIDAFKQQNSEGQQSDPLHMPGFDAGIPTD